MNISTNEIKDRCRRNLLIYTIKAFSLIPKIDNPLILDMGCGTGETSLALLGVCNGKINAVDPDDECVSLLKEKAASLNCGDRIEVKQGSVFDQNLFEDKYDIVLAEGLLNIIGFEKGLTLLIKYLKQRGYLIIHDELKNDAAKKSLFAKYGLELMDSFQLDEKVWGNQYYLCMERMIKDSGDASLCQKEIAEIREYKNNPKGCRSVYYILHKAPKE